MMAADLGVKTREEMLNDRQRRGSAPKVTSEVVMTLGPASTELVLAFADDEHLIGQRHTEWIGIAPFLEEDLAMTSIAQDELGHPAGLYELLTHEIDTLAFFRDPSAYRCCWFVEQPGTEWGHAIVRHWLYDLAERHRWESVAGSSHTDLAALSARALREETSRHGTSDAGCRRRPTGRAHRTHRAFRQSPRRYHRSARDRAQGSLVAVGHDIQADSWSAAAAEASGLDRSRCSLSRSRIRYEKSKSAANGLSCMATASRPPGTSGFTRKIVLCVAARRSPSTPYS